VLVQAVDHTSRVHIDIETNDIEAEALRLEALGAKRVAHVKRWWVMEAPTGQRFCVVSPQRPDFDEGAITWPSPATTNSRWLRIDPAKSRRVCVRRFALKRSLNGSIILDLRALEKATSTSG
jgi:hypothetical protein